MNLRGCFGPYPLLIVNNKEVNFEKDFNFFKMGIPFGSKVEFNDSINQIEVEVIDEQRVKYNGNEYELIDLGSVQK